MDIIKKLSQIDINDLRNIDIHQIKDAILKRPDVLVNILLIVLSLSGIIFLYTSKTQALKTMKSQINEKRSKIDIVKTQKVLEKEFKEFTEQYPKPLSSDKMIDRISELALSNNLQITSISPAVGKSNAFLEHTTVRFEITASDFNNMMLFMKDIEQSAYLLRVEDWRGNMEERISQPKTAEETAKIEKSIVAQIEIGTIKLK